MITSILCFIFQNRSFIKYKITIFLVLKFPIGRLSVQLVGDRLLGGRWSIVGYGRLEGGWW